MRCFAGKERASSAQVQACKMAANSPEVALAACLNDNELDAIVRHAVNAVYATAAIATDHSSSEHVAVAMAASEPAPTPEWHTPAPASAAGAWPERFRGGAQPTPETGTQSAPARTRPRHGLETQPEAPTGDRGGDEAPHAFVQAIAKQGTASAKKMERLQGYTNAKSFEVGAFAVGVRFERKLGCTCETGCCISGRCEA